MNLHMRVARATDHMDEIRHFYESGLGFSVIGAFADHDGFDGLMLGHPGGDHHLEFTHERGTTSGRAPNQESLLVFYFPNAEAWAAAVQRMREQGYDPVRSHNPYWDVKGKTFEDRDGYRVVLQQASWANVAG